MKIIFLISLIFFSQPLITEAKDLEEYGAQCKDIGFKPKTPAYGDCVLELRKREGGSNASLVVKNTPSAPTITISAKGDGTSEDKTCRQYGFNVGTEQYSQCRLQLSLAKSQFEAQQSQYEQQQRQYQEQRSQYEAQVAAQEKAKEKEKSMKLMELGFRMMGGQPIGDAAMATAGMQPISPRAPARPVFENYSITMPGGRTTNCTYNTAMRSMNCM